MRNEWRKDLPCLGLFFQPSRNRAYGSCVLRAFSVRQVAAIASVSVQERVCFSNGSNILTFRFPDVEVKTKEYTIYYEIGSIASVSEFDSI